MIVVDGKNPIYVFTDHIDDATYNDLIQMANHPALDGYKAVMPDCHRGKGSCIGFTMPLDASQFNRESNDEGQLKVIPNVVGVDIG